MGERGPEKPRFGSPCNGCGYCCAAEQCHISLEIFGAVGAPCPALEFDVINTRFYCGVLREAPYAIQPTIAFLLGIGRGCDADDPESQESEPHAIKA